MSSSSGTVSELERDAVQVHAEWKREAFERLCALVAVGKQPNHSTPADRDVLRDARDAQGRTDPVPCRSARLALRPSSSPQTEAYRGEPSDYRKTSRPRATHGHGLHVRRARRRSF